MSKPNMVTLLRFRTEWWYRGAWWRRALLKTRWGRRRMHRQLDTLWKVLHE